MENFDFLIGLTLDAAKEAAKPHGITAIRPRMIDGKPMFGTADFVTTRLNVSLRVGVISAVSGRG